MELGDELNIRCLLSDLAHCDYRTILKEQFSYDIPTECPYRSVLKTMFEQYLADKKYREYKKEYDD